MLTIKLRNEMPGKVKWIIFLITGGLLLTASSAGASVILNEVFADPPSGLSGDANGDGVRSSRDDEFIELLNFSSHAIDISNWYLTDNVSTRHVFPSNTILFPYTFLAVFGGGNPDPGNIRWQLASSGSLGLNNGGDSVSFFDQNGQLIDQVTYGSIASHDQSITRFPDGRGDGFVLHSSLEQAQGALFSPGTSIDFELVLFPDEGPVHGSVVGELPALLYFVSGLGPLFFKRRNAHLVSLRGAKRRSNLLTGNKIASLRSQ